MMVTLCLFCFVVVFKTSTNCVVGGPRWRQEEGQVREGPQVICDRPHGEPCGASWMQPGQGYSHLQNPSQPNDLISPKIGLQDTWGGGK